MSGGLTRLAVRNFRSLADIALSLAPLQVLFGPNGAGKSTLLDTIWFIRDCAIRGVDAASSVRSHGIGLCAAGADETSGISITIESKLCVYDVRFGYSSGRIESFVGESLKSKMSGLTLIDRKIGGDKASFYDYESKKTVTKSLKEPEKLALTRYVDFAENSEEAAELDRKLRKVRLFNSRAFDLFSLKRFGSESASSIRLQDRAQNLWSVLRNLHDRRDIDDRYETIMNFMKKSFPSFRGLFIVQSGPSSVHGNFIEKPFDKQIAASGVSDGHLQMLILLTALFAEGLQVESLIMFDEPEASLHPHALALFAKAVTKATESWKNQVFIATHSPVLISQFEADAIVAAEKTQAGNTVLTRVSEIPEIDDLLNQYAAGSLYMAQLIAPQSRATEVEGTS